MNQTVPISVLTLRWRGIGLVVLVGVVLVIVGIGAFLGLATLAAWLGSIFR